MNKPMSITEVDAELNKHAEELKADSSGMRTMQISQEVANKANWPLTQVLRRVAQIVN